MVLGIVTKEGLGERWEGVQTGSVTGPRGGTGAALLQGLIVFVPGLDSSQRADRVGAPLKPWCSAWQMEAIGKLSDDMRRHFRMKLRNLFTKFIRKFGSVH